ncbi:hypothetical protein RBH20_09765 [Haloarcula sp. H-GB4]|uniref:hypothetical protein n=1 Tax=Haloarcula sp. H-GB4 TaxID=3069755 RepID=UPI0027B6897F|nr:hypothetical protein [Haloarcula sp. H-GB4]MDQ2072820.1 hypothetical protein [Haloarcula sp. H-GB4]
MSDSGNQTRVNRRHFLSILGAAGTSALAGCGSTSDTDVGSPSDKDVPAPSVDTKERWQLTTPDSSPRLLQKGSVGPVKYTAHGHVTQYEDVQLRQQVSDSTFGEIDRPFAVAFAARVDIFPDTFSMATGLQSEKIDSAILGNLKSAMNDFGVQNVQQSGTMDAQNTPAETFEVVRGDYPIQEVTIDGVDIPHSDRNKMSFGGGTLPIKGIAGRWKSNGSILAGGGVYPDADFEESDQVSMSDAISMSVNVDLDLQPNRRESQILNFVRSISL